MKKNLVIVILIIIILIISGFGVYEIVKSKQQNIENIPVANQEHNEINTNDLNKQENIDENKQVEENVI